MRRGIINTLKRIDDLLEVVVFDWALHPSRRRMSVALTGVCFALALTGTQRPAMTPQEHLEVGTALLTKKAKTPSAVQHLEAAAEGLAGEGKAWQSLGHAYLNADRPHDAIRAYQRAVELDASTSHLFFLGYGYVKADLPEVALGTYQQILSENAFFYPALAYQGVAHDKAERYVQAKQMFHRALAYNPDYLPAHFHLGITYVNTQEYDRSIRSFEKVIQLDPTEAAAYYNIACCYSLMGNVDEAVKWLAQSVERGFNDYQHMDQDGDLDNMRTDPRYQQLREQARQAWETEAQS